MSEYIAHIAVFDDCARLAIDSDEICDTFKETITKHWDIGRMGCVTRDGDKNSVYMMNLCRDNWQNKNSENLIEEKLAFLIGWRCHNAADRMFKPVYIYLNPEHYLEKRTGVSDIRIYHDVVLYREVYDNGNQEPFLPSFLNFRLQSHPAASSVNVDYAENLFSTLWQRELLNQQIFQSEDLPLDEKLKLTFSHLQDQYVEVHRFSEAYYNPDPDKMRRFILEPNYYDRYDPLVRLARSLQREKNKEDIDLFEALEAAKSQSQYAQVLEWGYRYLKAASDYFEGKIDVETFGELSDFGKPHRPKEAYEFLEKLEANYEK